jgi:allantoinase
MTHDRVIRNGRAVLPQGVVEADICIRDGCIAAIGTMGSLRGSDSIEARGMLVFPGAIDMHVHFRDPGLTHKEDFAHGSAAAACGGVTTIADMPNTRPPVVNAARFKEKLAIVRSSSWVDFGLWAGGTQVGELEPLAAAGAIGLKVYMNRPRSAHDPYSNELSALDDAQLLAVLNASARIGWPVSIHVASPAIDFARMDQFQADGWNDACAVCYSYRAPESVEALAKVLLLARISQARAHVAHVSLNHVSSLDLLADARSRGHPITVEVVPPALGIEELPKLGVCGAPFAHSSEERERYWAALASGLIDVVATDHAPHSRADKAIGDTDVWQAPPGYPGVETSLPLMIDAMLEGKLSPSRVAAVMAENPARILGLPTKGRIAVGCDADLALVDPNTHWTVDEAKLHSKAGWSPYHGRTLRGRIRATLLRGTTIARDGELVGSAPTGRMVTADRSPAPPQLDTRAAQSVVPHALRTSLFEGGPMRRYRD